MRSTENAVDGQLSRPKSLHARFLSGSVVLLTASGLATAINFGYNVAVARLLGPAGFGHATAVYTLLTLMSAITLSFQIITAKIVAQQDSPERKVAAYRGLARTAWLCGVLAALLLLFFRHVIAGYLRLPVGGLVALLSIGAAFYVPLGSRRGYVQGAYGFDRLARNLVLEGAVRLTGSLIMIGAGFGVRGVIAANSAAMAIAYLALWPDRAERIPNPVKASYALRETAQALVFYSGQVVINNCDIILVKHFFTSAEAGLYAAIAMVGRVVFAFSSAVVNSMFPLVAGTREEDRRNLRVILTSLLLVSSIGACIVLVLLAAPERLWALFFGKSFVLHDGLSISTLLALYAIVTVVYCLSVVIISYEMSYKIANTSWIQLAFSGILIAGISRYHASLEQVIVVQLILMCVMLLFVAVPFLLDSITPRHLEKTKPEYPLLRLLQRVSEDEVIGEFLKSDFSSSEFSDYQDTLSDIVHHPDYADPIQNAQRRALLNIRHQSLWSELPANTRWYEVELTPADVERIRVFPRAQWKQLAQGDFTMKAVLGGMDHAATPVQESFVQKIGRIRSRLEEDERLHGAVLLIGIGEAGPLTILDGNHRLVAALTASPQRLQNLRFLCGLSPLMVECCWYNSTVFNLFRYGRNVLVHSIHNPRTELAKLLQA